MNDLGNYKNIRLKLQLNMDRSETIYEKIYNKVINLEKK